MTKQLASELVRETGIDGVGVAVFATYSTRDLVFASDGVAEELDELQFTLGEGLCLDAYRLHSPERHDDMAGSEALTRWPLFAPEALSVGAASVYAYPLGGGGAPFGVLELYGRSPIALSPREDLTCRSYAHTIAHAVVSELGPASAMAGGSGIGVFRRGKRPHRFRDTRCTPKDFGGRGDGASACAGLCAATTHHRDRAGRHRRGTFRHRRLTG
ncbi:GAF domain-containing protein [Rhodococcus erythropolis]|uniref:GAF domain-containing protein n=1 Tax=Rhodococcus erythropolis TaxID=1833 RepID=UPI00210ED4C4|nr:GAF domain-containing protein [Rhodococcus erythropolis]